jgi:hypothetical protein
MVKHGCYITLQENSRKFLTASYGGRKLTLGYNPIRITRRRSRSVGNCMISVGAGTPQEDQSCATQVMLLPPSD